MYGLCTSRFNLSFLPYASRKIIANSWIGSVQEFNTSPEVVVISNTNSTNSLLPYRKENSLPMITFKSDNNTNSKSYSDKVFEWPVCKHKGNEEHIHDFYDRLNLELQTTLISLPIIYMSNGHLHLNRSSVYLNVDLEELNRLGFGHILKSADDDEDCKKKGEPLTCKDVKNKKEDVKKKDVKKEDVKKKDVKKKGRSLFGGRGKKGKKAEKKKSEGAGFSWASIEKQLPMWQNLIADVLQKLQDMVFKNR